MIIVGFNPPHLPSPSPQVKLGEVYQYDKSTVFSKIDKSKGI